ncbi:MAG: SAM-dependent methyltransferase [Candidatus Levybacteria bacterium]|nr:SAM-dependent methyltransferase [Candidatus Levybacteria bacterium]
MGFILINIFFGIIIVVSLVILWFVWPPDSPWSPWWVVRTRQIREGLRIAKVTKKDIVYDLGSGDGRVPIIAAREFGGRGVGIEIDYIRHLTAWLKVRLYNLKDKVTLKRGNFFDYNISDATVVFVYLIPRVLEKLKPKVFRELKKGTKIISYKYKFEIREKDKLKLVRSDTKNQIHLYKIT